MLFLCTPTARDMLCLHALFAAATAFTSPHLTSPHLVHTRCCAAIMMSDAQAWLTEKTVLLHAGDHQMPPLVQIPGGDTLPLLQGIVKPPDTDVLWQWEETRGNLDADCSWASVWPAAANLAAHLEANPCLVKGKRVAELGSGLGVAGLTAAHIGAERVTLVDKEPLALHCAMTTAVVCGLPTGPVPDGSDAAVAFYEGTSGSVVSASMGDWGQLAESGVVADVVLASEVLYTSPSEARLLARAAARLLKEGGTILLADPAAGRVDDDAQQAVAQALREMGAEVSTMPLASPAYSGDGYYTLRAGDGKANGALPTEEIVLVRADFANPPSPVSA